MRWNLVRSRLSEMGEITTSPAGWQRGRKPVFDGLHLVMHAITQVTAVPMSRRQEFASFFRRLRLDAPLFGTSHQHDILSCGSTLRFKAGTAIGAPSVGESPPRCILCACARKEQTENPDSRRARPSTLDSERSRAHIGGGVQRME